MWQHTRSTQKKSVALLYTKDKEVEREIRETSPSSIATNNIKYLGVTVTKKMKDLFDKNFKALKEEIEEDTRKWKDLPCSWISRTNIVKMAILPKTIYKFNAIPTKIPTKIFTDLERKIINIIWKNKKPIVTLMNISNITIEHLSGDGDRDRDPHQSIGLSSQSSDEEQEGEDEQGSQDHEGLVHPLRQCA